MNDVVVGLVVAPGLPAWLGDDFAEALRRALRERHADLGWQVPLRREALIEPPADDDDLVVAARTRLLELDWDLAICLTDMPLRAGRRPVVAHASPLHSVGLISVPALGLLGTQRRALEVVVDLVAKLAGDTSDDAGGGVADRLRQLAADDGDTDAGWLLTARTLTGNLQLLTGMVRANRPWRLAAGLSRALTAAVAAGVFALVTSDIWRFADASGPVRLTGLAAAAIIAVVATLIVGGGLWERAGKPGQRRQVALFNAATVLTVIIGVLAFYAVLFIVAAALAGALVIPELLAQTLGHPVAVGDYLRLACFTSSLATVGGALGAGLESDDTVHQAAYTYRSTGLDEAEGDAAAHSR